jgi:hypothetical protein
MANRFDEKSIYFHIDARLVGEVKTLHLYALLEGDAAKRAVDRDANVFATSAPRTLKSQTETTSGFSHLFCQPPEGSPPVVQVRAAGSAPGSICVIGTAIHNTSALPPQQVFGKIYPFLTTPDPLPPSGTKEGKICNSPSPAFGCPANCQNCNYVFHDDFLGELPGAAHSNISPYPRNTLAIWLKFGSSTSPPFTQDFFGMTSHTSECGSRQAFPIALASVKASKAAPAAYSVMNLPFPLGNRQQRLRLRRQDAECTESRLVYKSCTKECPLVECQLFVTMKDGLPLGSLALHSILGSKQESPAVWRSSGFECWQFDHPNVLTFSTPTGIAATIPDLTIVPG